MLVSEFQRIADAKETALHYTSFLPISLKIAEFQVLN
jgi:hypothetical protein